MKKRQKLLNDEQLELIGPLFPEPRHIKDNWGRPWAESRACFEGILWVLQTGAAWRFLPDEYPSQPAKKEDLRCARMLCEHREMLAILVIFLKTETHGDVENRC